MQSFGNFNWESNVLDIGLKGNKFPIDCANFHGCADSSGFKEKSRLGSFYSPNRWEFDVKIEYTENMHSQKKMLNRCGLSTYNEIFVFST